MFGKFSKGLAVVRKGTFNRQYHNALKQGKQFLMALEQQAQMVPKTIFSKNTMAKSAQPMAVYSFVAHKASIPDLDKINL